VRLIGNNIIIDGLFKQVSMSIEEATEEDKIKRQAENFMEKIKEFASHSEIELDDQAKKFINKLKS
jgi:hypothetical protein